MPKHQKISKLPAKTLSAKMSRLHRYVCGNPDCGHSWLGKPIDLRTDTRVVGSEMLVRCSACRQYTARHVPETEAVPPVVEKDRLTEPEKNLSDYVGILGKVRDSEALRSSIRKLSSGGELSLDDLLKFSIVDRLSRSENPNAIISSLQADLRDIKRELANAKTAAGSPTAARAAAAPPQPSAGDLLVKRFVESIPLASLFSHDSSGLKFNSLSDLQQASRFFQSSSGKNILDLEYEKAKLEADSKKHSADQKFEGVKIIADAVKGGLKDMGYSIGAGLSVGPEHLNPTSSVPAKPLQIEGAPVEGSPELLKLSCPECGQYIFYERGKSRVLCPRCDSLFTLLPEVEHSRSPDSESPRPAEVETQPQSQLFETEITAIGRGAKDVVGSGDVLPRRRSFIDDVVGGKK